MDGPEDQVDSASSGLKNELVSLQQGPGVGLHLLNHHL